MDVFPQCIDLFNRNAGKFGVQDRVKGIVGSIKSLPFAKEEVNRIWSEGAIDNIGFECGINEWRHYLKKDGYITVPEASWFTAECPSGIHYFWMEAYPEIDTIPDKVMQMEKAGYIPAATFVLPEKCWREHFYVLQVKA